MSLLTVIQNSCRAIGITPPNAVITSADPTILELVILSTNGGQAMAREYNFPELNQTTTFSATAQVNQGDLFGPSASAIVGNSDYQRMIPETFWNLDTRIELVGPFNQKDWAQAVTFGVQPVNFMWTVIGGQLMVGPVNGPTSGQQLYFAYYSTHWCESAAGIGRDSWAADTDKARIPEKILELDLTWRYKQAKGLAYAEDLETAERAIEAHCGKAAGRRLLTLSGAGWGRYISNIPPGNWGLTP